MSREYESGCLHAPNPALHPRDDDGSEAAWLGNPVRTSQAVLIDAIRAAVREAVTPTPINPAAGWIVLWSSPHTGDPKPFAYYDQPFPTLQDARDAIASSNVDPGYLHAHPLGGAA